MITRSFEALSPNLSGYLLNGQDISYNFSLWVAAQFMINLMLISFLTLLNATVIIDKTSIFVVFEGTTILSISETQPIQASGAF